MIKPSKFWVILTVLCMISVLEAKVLTAPKNRNIIAEQKDIFENSLTGVPKKVSCGTLINHELIYPSAKVQMFCNEAYRYCLEYHVLRKHAKASGATGYDLKFIEQITKNKLALCQTLFKLSADGRLDQLDQELLK